MWTEFKDMHSGGSQKEEWSEIFIEAPEEEAKIIFYNRFGHNPDRVTCTCCGNDYSINEYETLEEATAYERGCKFDKEQNKYIEEPDNATSWRKEYQTLQNAIETGILINSIICDKALFIFEKDIKPEERNGALPQQGYVWVD